MMFLISLLTLGIYTNIEKMFDEDAHLWSFVRRVNTKNALPIVPS